RSRFVQCLERLEPSPDPAPLDLDHRLVAHDPRVVPRRDIDHVVGTDVELIPRNDVHPSRDDRPDMSALTPVPTDDRSDVRRPSPPRLVNRPADRLLPDHHPVDPAVVERQRFVPWSNVNDSSGSSRLRDFVLLIVSPASWP